MLAEGSVPVTVRFDSMARAVEPEMKLVMLSPGERLVGT